MIKRYKASARTLRNLVVAIGVMTSVVLASSSAASAKAADTSRHSAVTTQVKHKKSAHPRYQEGKRYRVTIRDNHRRPMTGEVSMEAGFRFFHQTGGSKADQFNISQVFGVCRLEVGYQKGRPEKIRSGVMQGAKIGVAIGGGFAGVPFAGWMANVADKVTQCDTPGQGVQNYVKSGEVLVDVAGTVITHYAGQAIGKAMTKHAYKEAQSVYTGYRNQAVRYVTAKQTAGTLTAADVAKANAIVAKGSNAARDTYDTGRTIAGYTVQGFNALVTLLKQPVKKQVRVAYYKQGTAKTAQAQRPTQARQAPAFRIGGHNT